MPTSRSSKWSGGGCLASSKVACSAGGLLCGVKSPCACSCASLYSPPAQHHCSARSASLGRGGRARAGVRGVVKACVGLYSTLGDGRGPWNRRLEGRPTLGLAVTHWRGRPPPPSPPSSLPLHTPTHAHGAPSCPGPRCAPWGGTRTEVGHCQGGAFTMLRRQGSLHRCWRSQSRWRRQVHRPRARAARSRDQGAP